MCAAPNEDSDQGTFVVRGARIMTLLDRVFETTWVDSVPLQSMLSGRNPELESGSVAVSEPSVDEPEALALAHRFATLTPQQKTILRCLAAGATAQMIARRLGVTGRTVTRRIAEVYETLRVESRCQAGVAAHRLGLV